MKKVFWSLAKVIMFSLFVFNVVYYEFGSTEEVSHFVATAAAVAAAAVAFANEEKLSFRRVFGAYLVEAVAIVLVLIVAPANLLLAMTISLAGIVVVWLICILP